MVIFFQEALNSLQDDLDYGLSQGSDSRSVLLMFHKSSAKSRAGRDRWCLLRAHWARAGLRGGRWPITFCFSKFQKGRDRLLLQRSWLLPDYNPVLALKLSVAISLFVFVQGEERHVQHQSLLFCFFHFFNHFLVLFSVPSPLIPSLSSNVHLFLSAQKDLPVPSLQKLAPFIS